MSIDFQQLKHDNNIVDVIGRHLALKKKGSEYYGICPFHADHQSSLQVNETSRYSNVSPAVKEETLSIF